MKNKTLSLLSLLVLVSLVGCANFDRDNPLDPSAEFSTIFSENFEAFSTPMAPTAPWLSTDTTAAMMHASVDWGMYMPNMTKVLDFNNSSAMQNSWRNYYVEKSGQLTGLIVAKFDMRTPGPAPSQTGRIAFELVKANAFDNPVMGFGVNVNDAYQTVFVYNDGTGYKEIGTADGGFWYNCIVEVDLDEQTMKIWLKKASTENTYRILVDDIALPESTPESLDVFQFRGQASPTMMGSGTMAEIDNIVIQKLD